MPVDLKDIPGITPAEALLTAHLNLVPEYHVISIRKPDGKLLVGIRADGTLDKREGYHAQWAAQLFWEALIVDGGLRIDMNAFGVTPDNFYVLSAEGHVKDVEGEAWKTTLHVDGSLKFSGVNPLEPDFHELWKAIADLYKVHKAKGRFNPNRII